MTAVVQPRPRVTAPQTYIIARTEDDLPPAPEGAVGDVTDLGWFVVRHGRWVRYTGTPSVAGMGSR